MGNKFREVFGYEEQKMNSCYDKDGQVKDECLDCEFCKGEEIFGCFFCKAVCTCENCDMRGEE